jgi:DNA polymerase-1
VDTGRTSCRAPNLQGQDRKSGIRDAFVPRKKLTFRMFDFSQAEMRFAAHIAQEPMMIKGFNNDPNFDVHYATAQKMFGRKKPDDEMRGHAKTMNFAMLYGAGIDNVTEGLMNRMSRRDAIHACQLLGYVLHLAENPFRVLATLLKERYKESMPQMGVTAKQKERIAAGTGLVYNQYGRHRWLESDEAYKAFNSDIQGSAGDCAKFALVNVYKECQVRDGSLALLLLIHDELVTETDGDPVTDKRVLELMADTRTFSVPIVADMKGSDISWQQKTSIAS